MRMTQPLSATALAPQLDPQQIVLLRGLRNGTLLPQLLRTYREHATTQIEDLRAAAASEDAEAIRKIAHALKSSSYSIGANGIGELCGKLETNARNQQLGDNPTLFGDLVQRFTALLSEIEPYLAP
jgi:HPt (histidine-containing phosphotransfer) domain-containing protein